MIEDGSLDMKDAVGPTLTGTGFTIATVSPAEILQAIGVLIALFGAYYTRKRFMESQRYNDLYHERLKWEKEVHAGTADTKSEEKKATVNGSCESNQKATAQSASTNQQEKNE